MPGPTAFVPQSGPVEPTVRKALSVFATALAMLDKVHLLVIKRFNDKFLSFALAVPSDSSLRGPSLQEILSADRAVWQAVHALIRDHSWSLSDSLNEVAFCRQDIPSALQPRPRAAHVPNPRVAPADPSAAQLRGTPDASALSPAVLPPQAARKPKLPLPPPRQVRCLLPRLSTNPGTRRSTGSRRA